MSIELLRAAETVDLPAAPGIKPHTARTILTKFAWKAQADGSMRYGFCARTIARLCELSISTIRRYERYFTDHGILEKIRVGGGHAATLWRVCRERLGLAAEPAPSPPPLVDNSEETRRAPQGCVTGAPQPSRGGPPGVSRRDGMSPLVEEFCEHGGPAGTNRAGIPHCPSCRPRRGPWNRLSRR